jgi:hypothetical protein
MQMRVDDMGDVVDRQTDLAEPMLETVFPPHHRQDPFVVRRQRSAQV